MTAFAVGVTGALVPSRGEPQPVDYVRICDAYGRGNFYIPGTETCLDVYTNKAREQTEAGIWSWRIPNHPRRWVRSPELDCELGHLAKLVDIARTDLTLNPYGRFETNRHLMLKHGQYIESVM